MLVTTNIELSKQLELLKDDAVVAIDTEFDRSDTYYPIFSLIQFSGKKTTFAVDMLALTDHQPIKDFLNIDGVIKVFHSSRQDIEVLNHTFGFVPKNIFDTQIAALFLGFKEHPSFSKLAQEYLNKTISKDCQYSDWIRRPLSKEQLKYALDDVRLLYDIYYKMEKLLKKARRYTWAKEESELSTNITNFYPEIKDLLHKFTNRIKAHKKLILGYFILKEREKLARNLNLPRKRILSDQDISSYLLFNRTPRRGYIGVPEIETLEISEDEFSKAMGDKKYDKLFRNDMFYKLKDLLLEVSTTFDISERLIASSDQLIKLSNGKKISSANLSKWRKKIFFSKVKGVINS